MVFCCMIVDLVWLNVESVVNLDLWFVVNYDWIWVMCLCVFVVNFVNGLFEVVVCVKFEVLIVVLCEFLCWYGYCDFAALAFFEYELVGIVDLIEFVGDCDCNFVCFLCIVGGVGFDYVVLYDMLLYDGFRFEQLVECGFVNEVWLFVDYIECSVLWEIVEVKWIYDEVFCLFGFEC